MEKPAALKFETADGRLHAILTGDWTATQLGDAAGALREGLKGAGDLGLDLMRVRRMDTAGAHAVVRAVGPGFDLTRIQARPETRRLIELVDKAVQVRPVVRREPRGFHQLTIRIGRGVTACNCARRRGSA